MTTNPELVAARASVPEIDAAEKMLDAAKALLAEASVDDSPDAAREAVIERAADAFLSGGAWPKDVGTKAVKAYADADAVLVERQARLRVVKRAEWALYEALDGHTDAALAYLGTRLAELLSDARTALEVVGSARSAEDAIDAGADAVAAWSRLRGIMRDVGQVREAQWSLLRGPRTPGAPSGGDWTARQWMNQGYGHVRGQRPDEAPEAVREAIRARRVDLAYLRWLCARDDAYVPASEEQLTDDVTVLSVPDTIDTAADWSPTVLPPLKGRPSEVYPHSAAPQMDYSAPPSPAPTSNATPGDPVPPTYRY
ncbi:hypothetical protein [Streptomyces collinus]|uniref:hypothetical protein n=1 Tax=Streptomyces collinus TaxID=42684 RepID=UPI0036BF4900